MTNTDTCLSIVYHLITWWLMEIGRSSDSSRCAHRLHRNTVLKNGEFFPEKKNNSSVHFNAAMFNLFWFRFPNSKTYNQVRKYIRKSVIHDPITPHPTVKKERWFISLRVPRAEYYLHLLCIPEYVRLCCVLCLTILFCLLFFRKRDSLAPREPAIKNGIIFTMSIGCHFLLCSFTTWSSS